jgi:ketosteroid isomerase-like protein
MRRIGALLALLLVVGCGSTSTTPPPAAAQPAANADADLEKVLADVNEQWLCSGPYMKPYKDCVESRSKYWADQFFEVVSTGDVLDKEEMVATQTAAIPSNPPLGTGPYPDAFRLRAVYGDFAMGTDHTNFKVKDKDGNIVFANNSKVLRLFAKINGTWRPAAAGLVPIIVAPGPATPGKHSAAPRKSPDEQLEKQLAEIDHQWLDSAMNKRLDYLQNLFTDQWFEILGWSPTGNPMKSSTIDLLGKANWKPGEGVVPDQFQLRAVYGDVALATDRRTRTWTNEKGQLVHTPHRSLLVFVKQNGQWKSAGASLTPIRIPQ